MSDRFQSDIVLSILKISEHNCQYFCAIEFCFKFGHTVNEMITILQWVNTQNVNHTHNTKKKTPKSGCFNANSPLSEKKQSNSKIKGI